MVLQRRVGVSKCTFQDGEGEGLKGKQAREHRSTQARQEG